MSAGQQQLPGHRIVVGVDGTAAAEGALAWAVQQAELTGATVEAVIAWHYPVACGGGPFAPVAMLDTDFAGTAGRVLAAAVSVAADSAGPVKVSSTVREGNAAEVLIDAAEGADLLVVGSRGHGGFAEALLGSVSQHCVHHARCPVVIIPGLRAEPPSRELQDA